MANYDRVLEALSAEGYTIEESRDSDITMDLKGGGIKIVGSVGDDLLKLDIPIGTDKKQAKSIVGKALEASGWKPVQGWAAWKKGNVSVGLVPPSRGWGKMGTHWALVRD